MGLPMSWKSGACNDLPGMAPARNGSWWVQAPQRTWCKWIWLVLFFWSEILLAIRVSFHFWGSRNFYSIFWIDTPAPSGISIQWSFTLFAVVKSILVTVGQIEFVNVPSTSLLSLCQFIQSSIELLLTRSLFFPFLVFRYSLCFHVFIYSEEIPRDGFVLAYGKHQLIVQHLVLCNFRAF